MDEELIQFVNRVVEVVNQARNHTNLPYNQDLQKDTKRHLTALAHESVKQRKRAVNRGSENDANLVLSLECMIDALRCEIQMWIDLKQARYDKAWAGLIQAQNTIEAAGRAHSVSEKCGTSEYRARLRAIEKIVFPSQVYNSPAIMVKNRICTICEDDYDKCDHIAGDPYWGEFCRIEMTDIIDVDHIAMVDKPADKVARIRSFGRGTVDGEGNRSKQPASESIDMMTRLPLKDLPEERRRSLMREYGEDDTDT